MGGSFDSCSLPIQTEMIILLANGYLKLDELLNYLKMKYPVLSLMTYTFQCTPTQSSEIACVFFFCLGVGFFVYSKLVTDITWTIRQ